MTRLMCALCLLVISACSCRTSVCLGEYGFPVRRATFVSWGFDGDDKLVDVVVEKERDSL